MNHKGGNHMKDLYNIEDVAMMTGLSTRTIRSYISMGFLKGDKSSGTWHFTDDQLDEFLQSDVVRTAVRAKRNAIVYDFMGSKPQEEGRMCIVLDLPSKHETGVMKFFCREITDYNPKMELRFASDRIGKGVRVILSGSDTDVLDLLTRYYQNK